MFRHRCLPIIPTQPVTLLHRKLRVKLIVPAVCRIIWSERFLPRFAVVCLRVLLRLSNAAQVDGKLAAGDFHSAVAASDNAKMWSWISIGGWAVLMALYVVAIVVGGIADGGVIDPVIKVYSAKY